MGHAQSINTSSSRNASVASESGFSSSGGGRPKHGKEHKRHGVVTLKMVVSNPTRRANDQVVTHTITPKGCILYGSQAFDPMVVQQAISTSGYPIVPPSSLQLADNRAHKILVSYCKGWHIVPFPEIFSRHSGTCLILGDRTITSPPFQIKVGDCFRLGSVGLVVSEMRADGEVEQRIDAKTLEFLKDEALAFDTNGDMATLAADEERMGQDGLDTTYDEDAMNCDDPDHPNCDDDRDTQTLATHTNLLDQDADNTHTHTHQGHGQGHNGDDGCATPPRGTSLDSAGGTPLHFEGVASPDLKKPPKCAKHSVDKNLGFGGISPGERFVCYMCYETHDTEEDALVAPCDCRGDTRYLHVQCLQKWYQASITGVQTQVIRTTGNGAPACKICGSAYKTAFRRADGRKASLLETESNGPYLSLVVVTKHDTNPGLFNTKFRLNFHSRAETAQNAFGDNQDDNIITIGRSSSCNMILDYRTVSTIHARITYEADGKFYLTDRRSSNGTMVYLQDPFPLPYNHSLKLRMGRTTLSLQAKRNWTSSLRTLLGTSLPSSELLSPTPEDIQSILSECVVPEDHEQNNTVKEDAQNGEDEHRQDGESPVMHNHNNGVNNGAQQQINSRGGLYLRSNQPDGGEPDSDMDYSLDTHNHPNPNYNTNNYPNNTAYPNQQLHTSSLTLTTTNVHGALLTSTEGARSMRHMTNMTEDGSHRSMNTNNTNNNSLHSSMTGVTANTNTNLNHPYATLPFNSTQYSTSGRGGPARTSSGVLNGPPHGEESYVGLEEVHGLAMTAEERQEQADLDRAIELSLLEHNTKESATNANNATNANTTTNNNAATPTNQSTPANNNHTSSKEEVLMLSPGSRSNSSSRPYTPNTKTPNTHVSLNRTYTEFSSEGEHGIASFAANMNSANNTSNTNNTSTNAVASNKNSSSIGVGDNRKMSASTTPPRSRQTSQGNIGIGEHINSSSSNGPASPLLPKSPSKALMDFSQPRVVGENDDDENNNEKDYSGHSNGHSGSYERPPSRHLSGASSPAHYNTSTNTNTISVLQNGNGRIVMHDSSAEAEPINSSSNNNSGEGAPAGEGYLYPTTTSGTRSARGSGTSAGNGNGNGGSIHSIGSGKHTNNNNSNSSSVVDELSTSMPIANAFTPFGQMSQKKSTQNLSADNNTNTSTAPNTNTTTATSTTTTNNTTSNTPPTMEPIKESSTNSLYLSKEHSFVKNNSTTNPTSNTTSNTTHAPLEKQRSVKGVDSATAYPSGSAYIGGGSGNESPTMQRNATTLDLETSPDHDEHDQQR